MLSCMLYLLAHLYHRLKVSYCDHRMCTLVCLFVWCLTTHQPLWVISVRHDGDGKSKKNVISKMKDDDEFV